MIQFAGAMIPVPAIVIITLNLVQDGVNPSGRRIFVLLHELVGRLPMASDGKFDCLQQGLLRY